MNRTASLVRSLPGYSDGSLTFTSRLVPPCGSGGNCFMEQREPGISGILSASLEALKSLFGATRQRDSGSLVTWDFCASLEAQKSLFGALRAPKGQREPGVYLYVTPG